MRRAISHAASRSRATPPGAAQAAVARATGLGLVDDARFAVGFAQTRAGRGRGPLRLRRDLASLGVDRAVIEKALAEAFGENGVPAPDAGALARRRLQQLRGLPRPVQRRRLLAFLARRGFSGGEVRDIVSRLLSDTP
ncbi:MAG: RecX family transcriptional regulator [Gemmatimonadales bacterium]|nr:RecX family transcriptional regulator [Gemmatimonadales bacterium]